jgi:hypothetical protein
MRMRRIILSSVACLAQPYFPPLFHKRLCFQEKKEPWNLRCVFPKIFFWKISHSKKNWARCDQYGIMVSMKSTRYISQILIKLEFSGQCRKILKYQISWKFSQWEPSCSMKTDGLTDITKLIVAFLNFSKTPKNELKLNHVQKIIMGVKNVPYCRLNSSTLAAGGSNGVTNKRCRRYSCMRSWWWVEVPPETCRAVSRYE